MCMYMYICALCVLVHTHICPPASTSAGDHSPILHIIHSNIQAFKVLSICTFFFIACIFAMPTAAGALPKPQLPFCHSCDRRIIPTRPGELCRQPLVRYMDGYCVSLCRGPMVCPDGRIRTARSVVGICRYMYSTVYARPRYLLPLRPTDTTFPDRRVCFHHNCEAIHPPTAPVYTA